MRFSPEETKMMKLAYGEKILTIILVVLTQHGSVTYGRTDNLRERSSRSALGACQALRFWAAARPRLNGRRSISTIIRSQVSLSLFLQCLGVL